MSFYDLTKDDVLSASELFKYRLKRDATVPSKGGQKCFEPDGSWMHAKTLESFLQERTTILNEKRVEKVKTLVQGVWEQDKQLVDLKKPGKFWSHMGFTDNRRNWLYPEEALFLMETNTMEVYHCDIPMSIQEAYNKLIGQSLSIEEYQVYSHLRRLGYVVLRQDSEIKITPYEKQINLDKYMSKQSKKERKQKGITKEKHATGKDQSSSNIKGTTLDQNVEPQTSETSETDHQTSTPSESVGSGVSSVSKRVSDTEQPEGETPAKRLKTGDSSENPESKQTVPDENLSLDNADTLWYMDSAWGECFKSCLDSNNSNQSDTAKGTKDVPHRSDTGQTFPFPTIADISVLNMTQPSPKLLPPNVEVDKEADQLFTFNVEAYRSQHPLPQVTRNELMEEERKEHIKSLEFSCVEWMQRGSPKNFVAGSWAEFKKRKLQQKECAVQSKTPVAHLWSEGIQPLVRPEDAFSKNSILERLSIIQSADNETLLPNQDCMVDLKVSFSVHLPDCRFKKSMPGTPNHRVCVLKCSADPPNLADVQEVWSRFKDGVPLHCAVVDSGEIAFYIFDNTFKLETLPS